MWANLILIVFLLMLTFWWSVQGFFNAFLHLVCTIVAGVLAFSFWEPTAMLFMTIKPTLAWGTGLLVPFMVFLLVLRSIADRAIGANVFFTDIANKALGFVCGAFSSTLAAGICVIALGFMPLAPDPLGYQPYVVTGDGTVDRADTGFLKPNVEGFAGGFFSDLSAGSMSPWNHKVSLAYAVPDVVRESHLFRLREDLNASVVATPESIAIEHTFVEQAPVQGLPLDILNNILPGNRTADRKLVNVHVNFSLDIGTYDNDNTMRLAIPSVRLISHQKGGRNINARLHSPIAVIRQNKELGTLDFIPVNSGTYAPYTAAQEEMIGFLFSIPSNADPEFMMIRRLRLPIDPANTTRNNTERFVAGVGDFNEETYAGVFGSESTADTPIKFAETNMLPLQISKNYGNQFTYDGHAIVSTDAEQYVRYPDIVNNLRDRVMANQISVPGHMAMVRAEMSAGQATSIFEKAMLAAEGLKPPHIVDSRGQTWAPIAFVRLTDRDQHIKVQRSGIRMIRDLPIRDLGDGDKLFLYFQVERPITIVRYDFGEDQGDIRMEIGAK